VRAVSSRPNRVRFRFEAEDGTLAAATGAVTVTITAGDGATKILDSVAATADTITGIYYVTLPVQSNLDVLTAVATGTVDSDEISVKETVQLVDRRMTPLSVLRQDSRLADLPLLDFLRIVDDAEDAITNELNFSPVLTGSRVDWRLGRHAVRLHVPGCYYPKLPYALSRNGQDQLTEQASTSAVTVRDNALERGFGYAYGLPYFDPILGAPGVPWINGTYSAWLAHGWDDTPSDLQNAVLMLARHYAVNGQSSYPDRATRIMSEASEIWFSKPGSDNPFGLPEVDAAVVRYRLPEPLAGDPGAF
jgi:hypothetical protein